MDSKRLETLLSRYWNCVSTVEEEQELREYFNSHEVDGEMSEVAGLFRYFEHEKKREDLDGSFDEELLAKLTKVKPESETKSRPLWNYLKVAAALAVVAVASYLFRQNMEPENRPELLGTYEDPREAFEETKKALMLIASKMNKGKEQASKISIFNKAEEKIRNGEVEEDQVEM